MKTVLKSVFLFSVLFMFVASSRVSGATPTVALAPTEVKDIQPGGTFTVNVTISDVSELYGWQFNITFNPQILSVDSVTEGSVLSQVNDTFFSKRIDNTNGRVGAFASFGMPFPDHGANGSGVLASISFSVKGSGVTSLHFDYDTDAFGVKVKGTFLRTVVAGNNVAIDYTPVDGTFRNAADGGLGGVSLELIVGAVAITGIAGVSGFFLWRRRKRGVEESEESEE